MITSFLPPRNTVLHGDCIRILSGYAPASIDFVLTDPPYLVRYQSRTGQRVTGDDNAAWLAPAFGEIYRVLKPDALCLSFYAWNRVERFTAAWRAAGFRIAGHVVFRKGYASSSRLLRHTHECAYLLAKGTPAVPGKPPGDVIDWHYTGNRLHPTQKPISALRPLIDAFCPPDGLVLDPFCGSGSTLVAAQHLNRAYLGIEIDATHHQTATARLAGCAQAA